MRVVLQRVKEASVSIDGEVHGAIGFGFLLLVGIGPEDTAEDLAYLCRKIVNMRIFSDDQGKMNRSIQDVGGSILSISQFTLLPKPKKAIVRLLQEQPSRIWPSRFMMILISY